MVSPTNRRDDGSDWTAINEVVPQEELEHICVLCIHLHNFVYLPGVRVSGRSVGELEIAG